MKRVKTIKKAIALVLTALMVLSLVPATGVSAFQIQAGMTLAEFNDELTLRMGNFYANIAPEQETILKAMGDSIKTSSLSPYTTVSAEWDTILNGLVTSELTTKYGSAANAKAVLAKMIYSTMELMFYKNNEAGTDADKLDAAITNAYNNLYLPMDELSSTVINNVIVSHILTQAALSTILTEVKSTISTKLSDYASSILNAMSAGNAVDYVDIIANAIASAAVTNLFDDAISGDLYTLKNNFLANAGLTTANLGSLVGKIYSATAEVDATQEAPSVQFNLLINSIITFQGTNKVTNVAMPFNQAISLDSTSATDNVVYFKINPNRTIAGINVDMTNYFVASSSNETALTVTKQLITGVYYIKLTANAINNDETCYVKVYRDSVGGENYFFTITVNVTGANIVIVDKDALTTAITNAETLIASKTVGMANGNVTQPTKDAYQTAINTATAVKDDANATQADVDAAVTALAAATTAFNNAIIVVASGNVLLKKVGDANFSETFETIAAATEYVKLQADAVKDTNVVGADKAVRYYAVPKDGVTQIANRNLSTSKIVVCDELDSNSEIPADAVIWVSTQPGTRQKITTTDYFTKGVNAFPTIPEAVTAASNGTEIVIKDGNYSVPDGYRIPKRLFIRNGSNPVITGNMIFEAAAAGTTIEGITFGTGAGGALTTITVDSPNITIANLNLDNVALVVNAPDVAIQNVTVVTPPVGTPVITLNADADNTTISGFSFTEDSAAAGSAITVATGVTNTTITDSVVFDSATTITYDIADAPPTQSNIYEELPAVPVTTSNSGTETNVVLNIRKDVSAAGTIKTIVYLTGIDYDALTNTGKDIDAGHAVIGYTLKTLTSGTITPIVTANSNYTIVDLPQTSDGLLEVAYSRTPGVAAGKPTIVDIDGVATPVLDLFSIDFALPATVAVGDVYSVWLSKTSPNNELWRAITEDVYGAPGNTQPDPLPMLYTVSSAYILETVPNVTLTVKIQLPFEVKNNLTQADQGFNVVITDTSLGGATETYDIYTGAAADPYSTHTGATLVSTVANGYVSEYTLTLPGYVPGKNYDISITGVGYTTVTRNANLNTDLLITVWNNIRSATGANFLAGDNALAIAGDTETVNNSDFVGIAGQYGNVATAANGLVKYDINRDQKVNLKDVVYLLLNMKNFRTTY